LPAAAPGRRARGHLDRSAKALSPATDSSSSHRGLGPDPAHRAPAPGSRRGYGCRHGRFRKKLMAKMKTKKSAAKRFRIRPGGSVKRGQAFKRHILTKKTTKNKRHLRGSVQVHDSDVSSIRAMMPYA
jgi:large subunit ribosomal protein L35